MPHAEAEYTLYSLVFDLEYHVMGEGLIIQKYWLIMYT